MRLELANGGISITYGYYPYASNYVTRYRTNCCALGQISLKNDNTADEIREIINEIKKETELPVDRFDRNGGERAIFVITVVGEELKLEKNLEDAGFKMIYEFHSRAYNPEDRMLRMWIISW